MCDPGIPLPRMEVTFSMARLNKLEGECKQYMAAIQTMHNQQQEQREKEVGFFFLTTSMSLGPCLVAFADVCVITSVLK